MPKRKKRKYTRRKLIDDTRRKLTDDTHAMFRLTEDVEQETLKRSPAYDRISARVLAAVTEFNAAIREAHECTEMRVFVGLRGDGVSQPLQIDPQIYQLTHWTFAMNVRVEDEKKKMWQQVKDPRMVLAAGRQPTPEVAEAS